MSAERETLEIELARALQVVTDELNRWGWSDASMGMPQRSRAVMRAVADGRTVLAAFEAKMSAR